MAQSIVEAARRVDLLVSALPPEPTSTNDEVGCETAAHVTGGRDGGGSPRCTSSAWTGAALHQVLQELQAQHAAEVARLAALVAAGRERLQLIRDALDVVAGDMQRGSTAPEAAAPQS